MGNIRLVTHHPPPPRCTPQEASGRVGRESQGSLGQLGCPPLALEGRELSPSGWRAPAGNWPGPSIISLSLPSCLPRLERLQRIVSKLQMESGLCEEQLNQADTLLQSVSGRPDPAGPSGPRSGEG